VIPAASARMVESRCQGALVDGVRYRVVVEGELSPRYAGVFEGMHIECVQGRTAIVGTLTDQAHLQGLLQRIAGLGLTLVSVEPEDEQ
jgi:hypothetical protein